MARIRSVHPGLWTDESFVSVSPLARLLAIGLWNECDDQGAFDWKPITLKMRLLPADNVDMAALLTELEGANIIKSYEHEGRKLGLVRNFVRYQRPKKPNSVHFIPAELRTYVGSSAPSSEPEHDEGAPVPQKSEIAPQMEEEGGRRKGRRDLPSPSDEGSGRLPAGKPPAPSGPKSAADEERELFERGKQVLGPNAGGVITKLLKAKDRKVPLARAAIETAATKQNPTEYIGAIIRARDAPPSEQLWDPRL